MPYLTETDFNSPNGELNRAITKLLLKFTSTQIQEPLMNLIVKYVHDQKPRYSTFNDVVGALECAKMEYKRRKPISKENISVYEMIDSIDRVKNHFYNETIAPYEDKKILEHGDIFESVDSL